MTDVLNRRSSQSPSLWPFSALPEIAVPFRYYCNCRHRHLSGSSKKMQHNGSPASDVLSNLPNNVLENILTRLPLRDAVKTSVFSRKWRYNWATLPRLVFDDTFSAGYPRTQALRKELLKTIYEVLLLHNGPIVEFTLTIPGLESCPEINHLIRFLSFNNIQDFTLRISMGECHKLSPFLFSCVGLRHLHLTSCLFNPPPTFQGFERLISIKFQKVEFGINGFEISTCKWPLLEQLILEECSNIDNLAIDAPNLKLLYFGGQFKSICFKKTPILASVTFMAPQTSASQLFDGTRTTGIIEVFCCIPLLEYLYAGYYFIMFLAAGCVPNRLPAPLSYLKTLVLCNICFGLLKEFSSALCLIRSSPNLEMLKVQLHNGGTADEVEAVGVFLESQDFSDVSLNKLREIQLLIFDNSKPEMEFVKLLLVKSPLLEKMCIKLKVSDITKGFRVLKEVIRFRRASSTAEIIVLGEGENFDSWK